MIRARLLTPWVLAGACLAGCGPGEAPAPSTASPDVGGPPAETAAAEELAPEEPAHEEPPPLDGRGLYLEHCAGCHGTNGDGRGTTELEVPARSFQDGHFTFGNTPEALFKTVGTGIPGRSPMPGFIGVLDEEQRWLVVEYVRTLLPPEEPVTPEQTILEVSERPRVVRGLLPPVAEGLPERTRGLLVGYAEGLTFEYRVDDVRLLAVRQGGFADRRDWVGRGGDALAPLGAVIHLFGGGDPRATFALAEGGEPLEARLTGSWVEGSEAGLSYALFDGGGARRAEVRESNRVRGLATGAAFERRLDLQLAPEEATPLTVEIASWGEPVEWLAAAEPWHVARRPDGQYEAIRVEAPGGVRAERRADALVLRVEAAGGAALELAAAFVTTPRWDPGVQAELEGGLVR